MNNASRRVTATLLTMTAALVPGAVGAGEPPATDEAVRLDNLSILGDPAALNTLPGSAHVISERNLARFEHTDVLRVLRSVPGVYVQEEDGFGLRPNIGIRGSGLDRSSRITLLEDGVLIAPAPYAAPAAYYFPTQRRMTGVEVLKGPAAITQGPRTTGGVLNLRSTPIPYADTARLEAIAGEDGLIDIHAWVGDSGERFGWLVETVQQRNDGFKNLDSGGNTGYDTEDYLIRLRVDTDQSARWVQGLELKLGHTDHDADETYLGLTDDDFDATPYRRYAGSQLDNIQSEHKQIQATWSLRPRDAAWELEVTAYHNDFDRNWYKLEKVEDTSTSDILSSPEQFPDELAWLRGDADSPDDALTLRNNNRSYYARGVQGRVIADLQTGPVVHGLEAGWRYHEDQEDRFQDEDRYRMRDAMLELTRDGAPGSQSNRKSDAQAFALYASDTLSAGAWQLTPGVRWEHIELERRDYATDDPARSEGSTASRHNLDVLIPGLGVSYRLGERWLLLGGVHKGFNPPAPGNQSEEEQSVNVELGARYARGAVNAEAILFYNAYDNLVGTCTVSTGGDCEIGDQYDGGEATVNGAEMLLQYELASIGGSAISMPIRLNYTYTHEAEFNNSFDSGFSPWGDVQSGDELPYIPAHQGQLGIDLIASRWDARLNATYVDETRTVAGHGSIMDSESTDAHLVLDLAGGFSVTDRLDLFVRIDNVLDDDYIVARRPAGIRPGKPRTAMAGFRFGL